ncbi:alkyl hydroperoxide reductase/ Thiol specific antioxidant/ Mal allergen [Thalassoporum mexicanum PCC 7367]|uniref:peroxiredoxin-like family protein n=1 Tax=Thalassoporum mexicanum TaxID=3457544 RepID=UPI00029FB220|nr:peroxiredoxin-like family protein [Pseudanabaena sp. PCC 7367]AFY71710.1 alkyl hydroperoxide reductase/ Thiol specific antioxidant/ Mal allergen [Pseudanabaena sp. PCC 7367]
MSLTTDLANIKASFRDGRDPEILAKMDRATEELGESGIVDRSLKVGDRIPAFSLPNIAGEEVKISDFLTKGLTIISFYRGGWCPYCNMELRALQQYLPQFQALGAELVAITPETPDNSLTTTEKNELSFAVLSDVGNKIARQFGLVFVLPEYLRSVYEKFGIDLPAYNGDQTFELPVPATYVVDREGKIIHAYANIDYTQRLDPEVILGVLQQAAATI